MKSWPKVKLGQVQVSSNIAQNHYLAHRKSYLVIICPNSHTKFTKSVIRSSYYLVQFGLIYPYLAPNKNLCPYLALLAYIYHHTYSWLYLGLITLIWAYLPLMSLILPYVPYSPYSIYFYWDCTSVQTFRVIGPLFMEILHFKDLGDTSVVSKCNLSVNLFIGQFFVCSFRYFTSVYNLKAIGPLLM